MKVLQALKSTKFPFASFTNRDVKSDFQQLKPHFETLVPDLYLQKRLKLPTDKIMRQRRMMNYHIEFDKDGNMTRFHEEYRLDNYDETKCLQYANVYEELTKEMKQDQIYKDFLYNTLQITWQLKQYKKAQISVHAVRTISYPDQPAQSTPEGPNRDGNDLEIIGVVNKINCQGADSQIYSPDKSKLLFEMSLEPGEGYIIDDKSLWNYATSHKPVDQSNVGVRDILGFVLKIDE
ncbi:unnamed protein product [Paramecium sonneborni]|uniref:Uncharacterized protein n=1 Tax=Paramecium sonneborni TaxID=65129 RepID=A0A8S1R9S1_9CILI|nr:unnamed protein product [Paramecium sonneborni]